MSVLLRVLTLFGILICSACSSSTGTVPVEGKVLYKGKELAKVLVTLHPKGGDPVTAIRPTGLTGDDGTFKLTTGENPGAPPGDYTVTFVWIKDEPVKDKKGMGMGSETETSDGFNGTFANAAKSKHTVTIKNEAAKLEPFQLD
jgi:hypothetical protein